MRRGDDSEEVLRWQVFLVGRGFFRGAHATAFGPQTEAATRAFQKANGLQVDGVVGPQTEARAYALGFRSNNGFPSPTEQAPGYLDSSWPPPLDADRDAQPDVVYRDPSWAVKTFGAFGYKAAPTASNPEAIVVTDGWDIENIIYVEVPQLRGIRGAPVTGRVSFHKKATHQLQGFFAEVEAKGLLPFVLAWDGSYVARFIRGSTTTLSNHAWGTAFDINAAWNGLGAQPALVGEKGTVRPLVPIAEKWGFFWGGRYKRRTDGMHFEICALR